MAVPYVALIDPFDDFSPTLHRRRDLRPLRMVISQNESEFAYLTMEVVYPEGGIAGLENKRVVVSENSALIFDGYIQAIPRGIVSSKVTIEAIAKPRTTSELDQMLSEFADELKQSPFYDGLFIPTGSENDYSEILAGYNKVLNHSRIQGAPFLSELNEGQGNRTVMPILGSLEYSQVTTVPRIFRMKLEANWKQIGTQNFSLSDLDTKSSVSGVMGIATMTSEEFLKNWPAQGFEIGDGFKVVSSKAKTILPENGKSRTFIPKIVDNPKSLDPAWAQARKVLYESPDVVDLDLEMQILYSYEVQRTETATIEIFPQLQEQAFGVEVEEETISLRDLTERSSARPWQEDTNYIVGQQVIDGGTVYMCRTAHRSGRRRVSTYWTLVGETNYVASRRMSSFFKSARGQDALQHAIKRLYAKASYAARCVSVKFSCAMPASNSITIDSQIVVKTPKLPGGEAVGRLMSYELVWEGGRRILNGTIGCTPGQEEYNDGPYLGSVSGTTPRAAGSCEFSLKNTFEEQRAAFEAEANIPVTELTVTAKPVANTDFTQSISVNVAGQCRFKAGTLL